MKDYVDWTTHPTDQGEASEVKALLAVYDFAGYGRFTRLVEMIGKAPGCELDLSKKVRFNAVANELHLAPKELAKFLAFLGDPEECGLLTACGQPGDNIWTTCGVQADLARLMTSRRSARKRRVADESTMLDDEQGKSADADSDDSGVADESEMLDDEQGKSADASHTLHYSLRVVVEEPAFQTWLIAWAEKMPHINNPPAFVKKALQNPDSITHLVTEYLEEQRTGEETRAASNE